MLLCLKKKKQNWLPKGPASLTIWTMNKGPPPKKKSVNFPHALFSLLNFLTLEAGTDSLF